MITKHQKLSQSDKLADANAIIFAVIDTILCTDFDFTNKEDELRKELADDCEIAILIIKEVEKFLRG